jgi:Flp pilus assembly pilin Flp
MPEDEAGEVPMSDVLLKHVRNEHGQTFVEYALLLAVVVVGITLAAAWTSLAAAIGAAIGAVGSAV